LSPIGIIYDIRFPKFCCVGRQILYNYFKFSWAIFTGDGVPLKATGTGREVEWWKWRAVYQ